MDELQAMFDRQFPQRITTWQAWGMGAVSAVLALAIFSGMVAGVAWVLYGVLRHIAGGA